MISKIRFTIIKGPVQGTFVLANSISSVTVGRSNDCKVALADPSLSRFHFNLSWDGKQCHLTDMNTTNGTVVNGIKVKETLLQNGDTIIAGDSIFKVDFVTQIDKPVSSNEAQQHLKKNHPSYTHLKPLPIFENIAVSNKVVEDKFINEVNKDSLLDNLAKIIHTNETSHWYAVIDGAQSVSLAYQAKSMGYSVYTLFTGESAQDFDLASVGPCVIYLQKPLPFLENWVNSIGENSGILLQTDAEMDVIYAHLRNIFIAQDEKGQDYFFRYYDPRVFNSFLPTCTDIESGEFFGVVKQWIVENDEEYSLFSFQDTKLKKDIVQGILS